MSTKLLVIPLVLSGLVLGACSTKESATDQKVEKPAKPAADATKKTDAPTEKPPAPAPEKK